MMALALAGTTSTGETPDKVESVSFLTLSERCRCKLVECGFLRPAQTSVMRPPLVGCTGRHFSVVSTEPVTIAILLAHPDRYHKKRVSVRGKITQPELHLDETGLVLNFVFVLKNGEDSLVVFGKHDQTRGGVPIVNGQTVEVSGLFWKDRVAHDYHFSNNLEAFQVTIYPPLTPEAT